MNAPPTPTACTRASKARSNSAGGMPMATIEFPHGQVALVTGAAGGIGSATVRRYAEEGVGCALVDMHNGILGTAEKFAAEFPDLKFQGYVADLTDEGQVADLIAAVDRDFNRLDHLAAVAGV